MNRVSAVMNARLKDATIIDWINELVIQEPSWRVAFIGRSIDDVYCN